MPSSNFLVSSFPPGDLSILKPHLRKLHLKQKTVLFDQADRVESVYFPLQSVISRVVTLSTGETIEAAMIGNDGAVGISYALDGKVSPSRAMVQISGDAMVCRAGAFKRAAMRSETLLSRLISHEQTVCAQAQQTAACMLPTR